MWPITGLVLTSSCTVLDTETVGSNPTGATDEWLYSLFVGVFLFRIGLAFADPPHKESYRERI